MQKIELTKKSLNFAREESFSITLLGKIMKRKPSSPGEILYEEFLKPLNLTQKDLADHLGCDYKVINRIINKKASVTPEMAIKLSAAFETTPDFG